MKFKIAKIALTAALSIALASAAQEPQTPPAHKRPRIGLVLDGGGALGLAHIGVLQWLEEHHIPVDIVTGASMGGLVGGAYATGRTPEQVKELVQGIQWDQVLSDTTPYRDLAYRRKQDVAQYPMNIQLGVNFKEGLRSQGGYKSGQQVQLLLDKIVLPYSEVQNFNDLPIPFGCVATDLVTGKVHVFHSGSLALAMRATMSLPALFSPVRTDNAIYADGGLVDNLPVDVAKDMGADMTVAIFLQTAPITAKEQLSPIGVLGRSISVMIAANELRSMQAADVLVSIPLQDYTPMSYEKTDELIKKGYDAAQAKASILEKLAVDDATWKQYMAERAAKARTVPVPQFVKVTGIDKQYADNLRHRLAADINKPIDPDRLGRQLTTIASDQRVANLSYGLTQNAAGTPGLAVTGREDPFGKNILRPLVVIDGWDYENITFSLGGRLTMLDFGHYGAELRSDLLVGSTYQVSSEYFRPFSQTHPWFVAPRLFFTNGPLDVYSKRGLLAEYRNQRAGGNGDFGYEFGRTGELRIGYESDEQRLYPTVGDPQLYPKVKGREGDAHVRFNLDRFDDPITPLSGYRLRTRAEWWDSKPEAGDEFPLAEISAIGMKPFTEKSSFYFSASGGSTLWKNPAGVPSFSLGGSSHLPAYATNELLTNQYFLFQGGYVRKLGVLSPLAGGRVLFFGGTDIGKAYYLQDTSHLPSDGAAGLIVNTLIGPIVVGAAVGDTGHYKIFFDIGRSYF